MPTLSRARPDDPRLHYEVHPSEGTAKAAVLLTHGYNEHSARYAHVVSRWNARGFLVARWDLRGHGHSEGPRGHILRFEEYVHDADELLSALATDDAWRACGKPILFGHSLGGLVASHMVLAAPRDRYRGLALSGPLFGVAMHIGVLKKTAGKIMSRLLPGFGLPSGLEGSDLTHDKAIAEAYDRDPLGFPNATARFYTEMVAATERALAGAPRIEIPVFCMHGGDDRNTSVEASRRFVAACGSAQKEHRVLAGQLHEILNELERDRFIDELADRMLTW